jgi:RNA polymerase sigma-70 factor, ECF subfamily
LNPKKLETRELRNLYQKHGPALAAYACSYGLDFGRAEDAVQQVFLKLLQGETPPLEFPVAYLYRAVRNACLNFKRDTVREVELGTEAKWFVHRGGDREAELTLEKGLMELPEEQREVVVMRIWSGMTLQEIAASTEVPLNTVASRYRYALVKLKQHLRAKACVSESQEKKIDERARRT